MLRVWIISATLLLVCGCTSAPATPDLAESAVAGRWLPWLSDGKTTRAQTVGQLGVPNCTYEGGRIVAYRLFISNPRKKVNTSIARANYRDNFGRIDDRTQLLVARSEELGDPHWRTILAPANYGLVLVFDGRDVLRAHRLCAGLPP